MVRGEHAARGIYRGPVVTVVEPPDSLVTLAEVKEQLRVEHTEKDDLIQAYLDAAHAALDAPGGWVGRALAPQTLQLAVYAPRALWISLPCPPVIELVSVVYDDLSGTEHTIDPAGYRLTRGAVKFVSTVPDHDEIRVRYRAGHEPVGEGSPYAPAPALNLARVAIRMLVADYWQNPAAQAAAPGLLANAAVEALLKPLKIYTLG